MSTPLVSIIIPCKEVDSYTIECINHCKELDYPNYEIILLPDILNEQIPNVKVIVTGPVSPGIKRNTGVKNSQGELCAFIDNDAYPKTNWLTNALKHFEDPMVGGVGGPGLTPQNDNFSQKASGFVMSSFMMGNLSNRYKINQSFESTDIHSCNFIARKKIIEEAGGWNEKYWPGEDTLMCLEINKINMKLIESSDVVVYHHRRALFKPHLKQVSRFGEHRGFFIKKFPQNSLKFTHFMPSLIILSFLVGALLAFIFPVFIYITLTGFGIYLALSLVSAILQVRDFKMIILVWMGIIATHIFYGLTFFSGIVKRDLKR